MTLDAHQAAVANAACEARQPVKARPGCGKTWLWQDPGCLRQGGEPARQGKTPESILLLSFTRTAVRELRLWI